MSDYLIHYRTPGSKNGVRLYQYKDGSLTPLGKQRYLEGMRRHRVSKPKVSKEFEDEINYNSQKNKYFDDSEFGNYRYIKGESLYQPMPGTSKPKASKEYQDEVNFNSQKNSYFKPLQGESLNNSIDFKKLQDQVNSNLDKQDKNHVTVNTKKQGSKEYQDELNFNSQKNIYPTPVAPTPSFNYTTPLQKIYNKERTEAAKAFMKYKRNKTFMNKLNSFIQKSQSDLVGAVTKFLEKYNLDDTVNMFLSRFIK